MPDPAENLQVSVDNSTETIRVDPTTGTIETDQPDGGVVVQLDAHRPDKKTGADDWFRNLADDIPAAELQRIANDLHEAIQADDNSRAEYLEIVKRGLKLLGTKLEEPRSTVGDSSGAVDGMSTVTNPLLLEALLKSWANAQAELLPAAGPTKIKDDGDETAVQDELAESLERDMNHWFTTTAAEYYPDTSHMLLWGTHLTGSGFKKVYRCPLRRRPVSESVPVEKFIVSDATKDLRACARITHEIPMRPSVMKRMKFIGAYRDVGLQEPNPSPNPVTTQIANIQGTQPRRDRPEDKDYTLWESQCELDLDEFIPSTSSYKGEGIPLPYLVTLDRDSREILAIRRDWDEDDPNCERKRLYVKYPYVPGPGFYGTGMLNILGNASAAMTAAWREALDVGMFANFPGGLIAKSANRQNSSVIRPGPGQFDPIETNGLPIQQAIMAMPYKDVTPGLMALIDKITTQAQRVGGAADIPASEGIQNVPVGTMLASIEQATKIIAAAHKGMHQAQAEELQMILDLFRAKPEDFWKANKICPQGYWNEQRFLQALNDCMLVPVSDPNVPSHIHRIAKALALVQLKPIFPGRLNDDELLRRCLAAIREDPRGLVIQPDLAAVAPPVEPDKMITAQAKVIDAQTKAKKAEVEAQGSAADMALKREELDTKRQVAQTDLAREVIIHAHDAERAARTDALAERSQQHEEVRTAIQVGKEARETERAAHQATLEHGLEVAKALHGFGMEQAGHELAVKEANKPARKGKK